MIAMYQYKIYLKANFKCILVYNILHVHIYLLYTMPTTINNNLLYFLLICYTNYTAIPIPKNGLIFGSTYSLTVRPEQS